MHTAQATKAIDCDPNAFEVGKLDSPIVTDHHVFDVTTAVDERADLSTYLVGKFGELARELRGQNLVRGDPLGVEFFYAAKLILLKASSVSDYVLDGSCPPVTRLIKAPVESG
ncbi:MAG: hypothetical protein ABJC10_01560 [Acidobacteriota bacterium]